MANPVVHLVTALAMARMGVAHIPIPISDAPGVAAAIAKRLELRTLVTDVENVAAAIGDALLIPALSLAEVDAPMKQSLAAHDGNLPWIILQSSGTTGAPKFSELTHHDTIQRCNQFVDVLAVRPDDVAWVTPRQDLFITKYSSIKNLRDGATICMPVGMPVSPELVDFLNEKRITLGAGIPSLLMQLVELGKPIPTLRFFGVTSAPVADGLRARFTATINSNLHVIYATNETGSITMTSATASHESGSVGTPAETIDVEIVDDDDILQPAGHPGHIRVRVPGAVRTYLGDARATATSFRDGWFYPGDVGRVAANGDLIFLGRKDDMMIFDGLNIFPAEIEAVLNAHPGVIECAAFPMTSQRFHHVPTAAVKLAKPVSTDELLQFCKQRLGMKHPRRIYVVGEFPRNAMGKILKRELPRVVRERVTS